MAENAEASGQWAVDLSLMDHSSGESNESDQHEDHIQGKPRKPRTNAACLTCRKQKTRCEVEAGMNTCNLCLKTGKQCIIAAPRPRRQRNAHRIADLEKKINALSAALADSHNQPAPRGTYPNPTARRATEPLKLAVDRSEDALPPDIRIRAEPGEPVVFDAVLSGIVDRDSAYKSIEVYRTKMSPFFPFVVLPSDLDIDHFRSTKPLLFSTIVLAAVKSFKPDVQDVLADEILHSFAERIIWRAERSLELIQCLLIYLCFHSRTLQQKDLNFNQMSHIACTMALDLGLGRRSSRPDGPGRNMIVPEDRLDARRAWVGCYYMSINSSMSLRQPLFVRWSTYTEECLQMLSANEGTFSSDTWLCEIIKLHHIAEDAALIFAMDDPASKISIEDRKIQYHLAALERQLEQWKDNLQSDFAMPHVRAMHSNVKLFIHEIGLHYKHNIEKFATPPSVEALTASLETLDLAPARVECLIDCLDAIHTMFDAVCEVKPEDARFQPNLFYVRIAYAAVALKAVADICQSNTGDRNHDLKVLDVRYNEYMDKVTDHMQQIAIGYQCRIANSFGIVLRKLKVIQNEGINRFATETDNLTESIKHAIWLAAEDKAAANIPQPMYVAADGSDLAFPNSSNPQTISSPETLSKGTSLTTPECYTNRLPEEQNQRLPFDPQPYPGISTTAQPPTQQQHNATMASSASYMNNDTSTLADDSMAMPQYDFNAFNNFDATMFDVSAFSVFDPTYAIFYDNQPQQ